jgi:sensor histidine kinase regulating citrate/malate metabolism
MKEADQNYASTDPEVKQVRKGLVNIGALGKQVFFGWLEDPAGMRKIADLLMRDAKALSQEATLFNPQPQVRGRLFPKLQTTKLQGRGLGLFICNELLASCGGDIALINSEANPRCVSGAGFLLRSPEAGCDSVDAPHVTL